MDSSESGQLPEGLSATAQVIIREQTDSVLIPLQALYGSVQAPTVRIVSGNDIIEREVSLGISDDFWVVVEDGLNEGETISMEVVGSSTSGIRWNWRDIPRGGRIWRRPPPKRWRWWRWRPVGISSAGRGRFETCYGTAPLEHCTEL